MERGVFTPLFFSTSGGMGEDAQTLFKKVATKMANKTGQKYSETITFIRKRLRFDLLNTTVIALRATWTSRRHQAPLRSAILT